MTGRVCFLDDARGYGFIRMRPGRVFFSRGELQNVAFEQLKIGNPMTFDRAVDRKGRPYAVNVWIGEWKEATEEI